MTGGLPLDRGRGRRDDHGREPADRGTLDHRRLACAVVPEDAKGLAGSDREANVIHCDCQPTGLVRVARKVRRVLCDLAQANPPDSADPHLAGGNPMQVSSAGTASRLAMREESAAESVVQLLAGRSSCSKSLSAVATPGIPACASGHRDLPTSTCGASPRAGRRRMAEVRRHFGHPATAGRSPVQSPA